jgi:hypothetical protein
MMRVDLNWWLKSDAGLLARVGIGAAIFAALAAWDLIHKGRKATRWREYLFLAAAAGAAMLYGLINDWFAAGISWEYFYFGKGLDALLSPQVPHDGAVFRWEACKIGLKATWSAGLIIGVALLIANNPRANRRQLPYRDLLMLIPFILIATALFAIIGAWAGSHDWLTWTSRELQLIVHDDLFRPYRFMTVYGMNLGAYVGGILGTVGAVIYVRRRRKSNGDVKKFSRPEPPLAASRVDSHSREAQAAIESLSPPNRRPPSE